MKLRDLTQGGHTPSLLSAFLHFDVSFMVWVILGALMPFITTDPALTGANLRVTPTSAVTRAGQYTLVLKSHHGGAATLLVKPGDPGTATRASVKAAETFVIDPARPESIAAVNRQSKLVRLEVDPEAHGSPHENVLALQPRAALTRAGRSFQIIPNGFSTAAKLTLLGIPLLAAAFWRIVIGALADRFGCKRVGICTLAGALLPLLIGWRFGGSYNALALCGLFLGLAGASFAVALPLASRWYPPHLQGLVLGIAGAGNSGTVLATLFAPLLARTFGWHAVMGLLMIPVAVTLVVFVLLVKEPPRPVNARPAGYASVLRTPDTWWFCLLYSVTFGGFVGLSSFLNTFFVDQYDAPKAAVGLWTCPLIVAGSLLRPVGGALSDRVGGVRMLAILYSLAAVAAVGVGLFLADPRIAFCGLFLLMASLGMGNGAVFQLVPQRFRKEIGAVTGLVGAAGGVGGYYLSFALGHLHDRTGTYAAGFYAFAGIAIVALAAVSAISHRWERDRQGRRLPPAGDIAANGGADSARKHGGNISVLE